MNDNVKTFLANLKHDIRNNEVVECGSGLFSGQELVDVAEALQAVPNEDIEDVDGIAIQEAYDFIRDVVLKTDPGVYDDIAAPVLLLLKQRLQSSWRTN